MSVRPLRSLFVFCSTLAFTPLVSAESIARFYCDDDAQGADIYVNGKLTGQCPDDVFLQPGTTRIRVVKPADASHERVYEKTMQVADDDILRIQVSLSQPRLTAAAIAKQEREQRQKTQEYLNKARAGDVDAMGNVVVAYERGDGVAKNPAKAQYWRERIQKIEQEQAKQARLDEMQNNLKLAQDGDYDAQMKVAFAYESGDPVARDADKAQYWYSKAFASIKDQAEKTDASADEMRTLSNFYDKGLGVTADPELSTQWASKAQARQVEEDKAAAQARKQAKIDAINMEYKYVNYFFMTRSMTPSFTTSKDNPIELSVISSLVPGFLIFDLIMAPTMVASHVSELGMAEMESASISGWENPDSMVAQSLSGASTPAPSPLNF